MPEASAPASTSSPSWLRRRVVGPALGLLRQGLSPEQLALTVAVGVGVEVEAGAEASGMSGRAR